MTIGYHKSDTIPIKSARTGSTIIEVHLHEHIEQEFPDMSQQGFSVNGLTEQLCFEAVLAKGKLMKQHVVLVIHVLICLEVFLGGLAVLS